MTVTDILIVEDEKEIADLLGDFLKDRGYIVSVANDGDKALALYEKYGAKLVVLDIMLPGRDGFSILSRIRERDNTPVIIVSAKDSKEDKLKGIIGGADDYIEKPYDIDILMAKIDGIFARRYGGKEIVVGDIRIDKAGGVVYLCGQPLDLTAKEYELLLLFVENPGKVLSKEYLFEEIWGSDSVSEMQTLTVHMKWLRTKLEADPKHPKHFQTVWGVGYKFEA
ncbi:MAG: response regulator transcription factor [Lachnospiraceae bacterium]|nr:response regulator transcription factor [Lachnospiraceae bacterium]